MREEDMQALIQYRCGQADHAICQAHALVQIEEWDGVVNRAYYAMFYAALALLLTKGLGSSKHAGVLSLIDHEFAHTGILPQEMAMQLRDAFNQRQKSDYKEFSPASETRAREILLNAIRFVDHVKSLVSRESAS